MGSVQVAGVTRGRVSFQFVEFHVVRSRARSSRGEKLRSRGGHRRVVRANGTSDVEAQSQLKGLADKDFPWHVVWISPHELLPRLIPRAAIGTTMDSQVDLLRNEHRPFVDVDTAVLEPCPELLRLGKKVVFDQRAFEPRKGGKEALAVAEVEGHPGPGVLPKPRAPPVALGTRGTKRRARESRQLRTMRQGSLRERLRVHVRAVEEGALALVAGEHDALVGICVVAGGGLVSPGAFPGPQSGCGSARDQQQRGEEQRQQGAGPEGSGHEATTLRGRTAGWHDEQGSIRASVPGPFTFA
ncbi:Hypothetical protein AA314_00632 [Archangium gephyra]|uniref:Uncharacterized protein n=1 Tax=Archangium gephyra TaxID=48 RepID=A0AAC8Q169_9BACT|nr:Hypothetical protein AA314_00632 [Archangium gephyra]